MAAPTIIWDFDGTLAYRPGKWGSALAQALQEAPGGGEVDIQRLRPHLKTGFPWHHPELPHPELCDPAAWWRQVEGVLARALGAAGYDPAGAIEIARLAGQHFRDPGSFIIFDDTIPALRRLSADGWRHIILSNHVPELEGIVSALHLADHFDAILSSANIGYEKPNPEAFAIALRRAGSPERVWMVGDNPVADVLGAESVGIPGILLRSEAEGVARCAADMTQLVRIVSA